MTLKTFLKKSGRSQTWLRDQLKKRGIERDPATISLWCNKKQTPRDQYVVAAISEILGVDTYKIKKLLSND